MTDCNLNLEESVSNDMGKMTDLLEEAEEIEEIARKIKYMLDSEVVLDKKNHYTG